MTNVQCGSFNAYGTDNEKVIELLHKAIQSHTSSGKTIHDSIDSVIGEFGMDIQKHDDQYWICNFTVPRGRQVSRHAHKGHAQEPGYPLPTSQQDVIKLYAFTRALIKSWFSRLDQLFLEQNIHVAVAAILFYFTTEGFFFKDNVRSGRHLKRVWTCLFRFSEYRPQIAPTKRQPKESHTTNIHLPKQKQQQKDLQKKLEILAEKKLDWEDSLSLHLEFSECFAQMRDANRQKNFQKLYNDYKLLTDKINKTLKKVQKVTQANNKIRVAVREESVQCEPEVHQTQGAAEEVSEGSAEEDVVDNWEEAEFPSILPLADSQDDTEQTNNWEEGSFVGGQPAQMSDNW